MRFSFFDIHLHLFFLDEKGVFFGVVPLCHDLLQLYLVVVRPEGLHGCAGLVEQVVGVAQHWQIEVGKHHFSLVEGLLSEGRADLVVLKA